VWFSVYLALTPPLPPPLLLPLLQVAESLQENIAAALNLTLTPTSRLAVETGGGGGLYSSRGDTCSSSGCRAPLVVSARFCWRCGARAGNSELPGELITEAAAYGHAEGRVGGAGGAGGAGGWGGGDESVYGGGYEGFSSGAQMLAPISEEKDGEDRASAQNAVDAEVCGL